MADTHPDPIRSVGSDSGLATRVLSSEYIAIASTPVRFYLPNAQMTKNARRIYVISARPPNVRGGYRTRLQTTLLSDTFGGQPIWNVHGRPILVAFGRLNF